MKTTARKIHIPSDFVAVDVQMEDYVAVFCVNQRSFSIKLLSDAVYNGILEPDGGEMGVLHVRAILHGLGDGERDIGIDPILPGNLRGGFVQLVCIEDVLILEQTEQHSGCSS